MVKARKQHKCCECYVIIKAGDIYEKVVGKWDGEFCTFKTCKICVEIRDQIFCSWEYSNLWEVFGEYTDYGNLDFSMLDGLSIEAIDKIEKYFEKYWNEEED
jgi:hypothetical protein